MEIFLIITGALFLGGAILITWAILDQAPWNQDWW